MQCVTKYNTQQNFYRPVAHQTLWTPVNCHYSQSNVAQFVNHWVVCGHCKPVHTPTSNVTVYPHTLEQTFTSLPNTEKLNCLRSVNTNFLAKNCSLLFKVMPSNEHEGQCLIRLLIKQMIKARLSAWTDLPQIVCLVSFKKEMKGSNEQRCVLFHTGLSSTIHQSTWKWNPEVCGAGKLIPQNDARHTERHFF